MATLVATLAMGACGGEDGTLVPAATLPQGTTTTNSYAVPPSSTRPTSTESSPGWTRWSATPCGSWSRPRPSTRVCFLG